MRDRGGTEGINMSSVWECSGKRLALHRDRAHRSVRACAVPGASAGWFTCTPRAANLVFARDTFLARAGETVEEMARARIAKTGLLERFDHLCNLQSAGNSAGP